MPTGTALLTALICMNSALIAFAAGDGSRDEREFLSVGSAHVPAADRAIFVRLPRAGAAAGEVGAATTGGVVAMESRFFAS